MTFLKSLAERRLQAEIIDEPDLDARLHDHALRGLERINWWSGSVRILWRPLVELARETSGDVLRVLDIATGAGDVPISLWRKALKAGIRLEISACDRSSQALAFARERAKQENAALEFFEWDAVRGALPGAPDVVTCSLFLHHLGEAEAVDFLRRVGQAARRMVLVNDLRRGRAGFVLAYLGTRILSSSPVVHTDGPRSVEGAFTVSEARDLALRAGLTGARVVRRWPCRYLLTWRRDRPASPGSAP